MTYRTEKRMRHLPRNRRHSVSASVAQFAAAGLLVAALLTVITGLLARRAGGQAATRSFESLAAVVAGSVVAPQLTPELRAGDPEAQARVQAAVQPLLEAGPIVAVSVLGPDGRVVWSTAPGSIGNREPLHPAERRAVQNGSVASADGNDPTAQGPADVMTASVGVTTADSDAMLVRVSETRDETQRSALAVWLQFAPVAVGALVVLELVQIPLAAHLARRVRGYEETVGALQEAGLAASQVERRRIASDIHDNIVPGLTGLAYELDAARMTGSGSNGTGPLLERTADGVRGSIAELRSLSADLTRAHPPGASLGPALAGLAEQMETSGTHVNVAATGLDALSPWTAEVLFRCAQETLRNVAAHSDAGQVDITVEPDDGAMTMVIDDDGRGFDDARFAASEEAGHLGLRALGGLVTDANGSLTAFSAPGQGTRVVVRVPLDDSELEMREST